MATKQIIFPAIATALLAGTFVLASGAAPPHGSGPAWATLAPVPHMGLPGVGGVEGASVACVGNEIIFAFGHDSLVGDTNFTRIYDIAHDTWYFGAPAPFGTVPGDSSFSSEGAGIAHGGLFYSVGGRLNGSGSAPRPDLMSYDPASDVWTVLAPMAQARAGLGVAILGNSIYAIGGRINTGGPGSGGSLASVERYDIATDTWTPVAPLMAPREDLAAAAVGGKIYVFGGVDTTGQFLADVDVYDPRTDTWSAAPTDMPTGRCGFYAVTVKGGTVYCIGGWDGFGSGMSVNEAYKVSQDKWTAGLLPMPTFRAETGAIEHGGRIFVLGGGQPGFGMGVDVNEVFKP
jgi:hypothetical protein